MKALLAILMALGTIMPGTALIDYTADVMGQNAAYCHCIAWNESRYDWQAVGDLGEMGGFQLLPSTADWIAEKWGLESYDGFNPATNMLMAMWLMKEGHHEWFSTHDLCKRHLEGKE